MLSFGDCVLGEALEAVASSDVNVLRRLEADELAGVFFMAVVSIGGARAMVTCVAYLCE